MAAGLPEVMVEVNEVQKVEELDFLVEVMVDDFLVEARLLEFLVVQG